MAGAAPAKPPRTPPAPSPSRTNTGEAYLVRDRASPDGGRVMVFTDITDKVRAETALAEQEHALADSRAQAEKQSTYLADLTHRLDQASASVNSAKTTLLRTMGHELKTPLNAILGFSDLMATLADNLSPAQIREYAGLVHQGGNNLLKIINQIMDLTKISAGRYDLRLTPVDAGGVLWLTRDIFLSRAAARGIDIDADRCPVGLMVACRRSGLHRHGAQPAGQCRHLYHRRPDHPVGRGHRRRASPSRWRTMAPAWRPKTWRASWSRSNMPAGRRRRTCQGRRPGPDPGQGLCRTAWRRAGTGQRPGRRLPRHRDAAAARLPPLRNAAIPPRI